MFMAKKAAGNKSQAIRDALSAHPDKSPKEIAELLAASGFKVNAQYVSTIKSNAKVKARRVVVRRKGARGSSSGGTMGAALDFIRAAGGLQQAQQLLSTIEQIKAAL
jgi:hypothetical protein